MLVTAHMYTLHMVLYSVLLYKCQGAKGCAQEYCIKNVGT